DGFDLRVLENFTDGETVTAAQDEDATRRGDAGEAGMDQGFVVAIFVAGTELEVAVEKEAEVVFEAREDQMLVARVAGEDDFVGVNVFFGGGGDFFGLSDADAERDEDDEACGSKQARCR